MRISVSKYTRHIVFGLVLLTLVLYVGPLQERYYLNEDVAYFKVTYLYPILICFGCLLVLIVGIFMLRTASSFKQVIMPCLKVAAIVAVYLFLFQNLVLEGVLFVNRQMKLSDTTKYYLVNYMLNTEKTKANFLLYNPTTKQFISDRKLVNRLYNNHLNSNDIVGLKLNRGLLSIAYLETELSEN